MDRITSHIPTVAALPAGEYLMGCDRGRSDERPVHRVKVNALAMGITTVTNQQYRFFGDQTGGRMPESFLESRFGHPRQPVVSVSWLEAAAYCHWLSEWTGQAWRLPTEAEWEWAIRQNREGCLYAWGDRDPSEFDLYRTGWRDRRPHPVALQPPNAFGLYDLGDNVHEWCLDWYGPYLERDASDPTGPPEGDFRVTRGGSHSTETYFLRSTNRAAALPEERNWLIGFRVACADYPVPPRPASAAWPDRTATAWPSRWPPPWRR